MVKLRTSGKVDTLLKIVWAYWRK